jgi:hypothetical protein
MWLDERMTFFFIIMLQVMTFQEMATLRLKWCFFIWTRSSADVIIEGQTKGYKLHTRRLPMTTCWCLIPTSNYPRLPVQSNFPCKEKVIGFSLRTSMIGLDQLGRWNYGLYWYVSGIPRRWNSFFGHQSYHENVGLNVATATEHGWCTSVPKICWFLWSFQCRLLTHNLPKQSDISS